MIKAIISDFDGTLVDTYEANFNAYQKAFADIGKTLLKEDYKRCFGLRFDSFMKEMGITDKEVAQFIKQQKSIYYPDYFDLIHLNDALIELITSVKQEGYKTAIASTASEINLKNVLDYFQLNRLFDLIIAGNQVSCGKPSPEIYCKAMSQLHVLPHETLIFEDSEVGYLSASRSGAHCLKISF